MSISHEQLNDRIAKLFGMSQDIIDKMNGHVDRRLVKLYKDNLNDIQNRIAKMYRDYGDNVKLAEMHKFKRLVTLEDDIREQLKVLGTQTKNLTSKAIKDNFTESYYHTGYAMETPLEINMGFKGLPADVVRAATINPLDKIKWPDNLSGHITALNDRVRRSVVEGLTQGYGYAKTARLVRDKIERTTFEAQRIIRTESVKAKTIGYNMGFDRSKAAGERQGFEVKDIWDATLDMRTRSEHGFLDGNAADKNGDFRFSDGVTTKGPGLSGVARHDINCRCRKFTQVGDMKPEFRRDSLNKETIPYEPYESWAKRKGVPFKGQNFSKTKLQKGN